MTIPTPPAIAMRFGWVRSDDKDPYDDSMRTGILVRETRRLVRPALWRMKNVMPAVGILSFLTKDEGGVEVMGDEVAMVRISLESLNGGLVLFPASVFSEYSSSDAVPLFCIDPSVDTVPLWNEAATEKGCCAMLAD